MIQNADDLLYTLKAYKESGKGRERTLTQNAAGIGLGFAKIDLQLKTLEMLSQSAQNGFYIPWTNRGTLGKLGRKAGFWGEAGFTFGKPVDPGILGMFERRGLFGTRAAYKSAVGAFGKKAAGSAATRFIIGNVAGKALTAANVGMWAMFGAQIIPMVWGGLSHQVNKYRGLEMGGGYFPETQGSATSRQRALQAITSSQLQARSAIGNEAFLMHR